MVIGKSGFTDYVEALLTQLQKESGWVTNAAKGGIWTSWHNRGTVQRLDSSYFHSRLEHWSIAGDGFDLPTTESTSLVWSALVKTTQSALLNPLTFSRR